MVRVESLARGYATGAVLDAILDDLFVRGFVRFKHGPCVIMRVRLLTSSKMDFKICACCALTCAHVALSTRIAHVLCYFLCWTDLMAGLT